MNCNTNPPIAPRRTASDSLAVVRVSSGSGTPAESSAAPPTGTSRKQNSMPERDTNIKEETLWAIGSRRSWTLREEKKEGIFLIEFRAFERSGEVEHVLGDGDDFGADSIAGEEGNAVAPGWRGGGRAADAHRRPPRWRSSRGLGD